MTITHVFAGVPGGRPPAAIACIKWRTFGTSYRGVLPDSFLDAGAFTHPPRVSLGWRFQATADDGDSHVFDIRFDEHRGVWMLLRAYD